MSLARFAGRAGRITLPVLFALALAACAGGDDTGEGSQMSSSAGLPEGRIAEGEAQANVKGQATGQSCIDCHGADGNHPLDPTYPKLGGQYRDYLAQALQAYRSGERDHALMSNQARGLDDQQIADLAAYFASRPAQIRDLHGVHSIH